jgi:hypothetical protein
VAREISSDRAPEGPRDLYRWLTGCGPGIGASMGALLRAG